MAYLSYLINGDSKPFIRKNPVDGHKYLRVNDSWVRDLSATFGSINIDGNIATIDCSTGNMFKLNLNSDLTLELANCPVSQTEGYVANVLIESSGAYSITFPSDWRFSNGEVPALTENGLDEMIVTCYPDGRITCSISSNFKL